MKAEIVINFKLFFLTLFVSLGVNASDNECKLSQPLTERNLLPTQLRAIIGAKRNTIKKPEDLICCLPKKYRSKYIVGHSSIAAQPGQPDSPRVILFNKETRRAFSINGGVEGQAQGMSVEYFIDNPQTGKAEYYDIECGERGCRMGRANPPKCMACHGDGSKPFATGGKPIFEFAPRQWPSFSGGVNVAMWCTDLYDEAELAKHAEARSTQALKENPRFRCLEDEKSDVTFANAFEDVNLFEMDSMVSEVNGRRFVEEMRTNPHYGKYKYIWIGEQLNCFNDSKTTQSEILSWISSERHSEWTSTKSLSPHVSDSSTPIEACLKSVERIDRYRNRTDLEIEKQLELAELGEPFRFLYDRSIRACSSEQSGNQFCNNLIDDYNFAGDRFELFDKYKLDTILKSPRGLLIEDESFSYVRRFIFEANEADDLSRWSTTPFANSYTRIGFSRKALNRLLNQDYFLKQLNIPQRLKDGGTETRKNICSELKERSIRATVVR